MNKCPLTGEPCYAYKCHQITDLNGGKVVKSEKVCKDCFKEYIQEKPDKPKKTPGKINPADAIKTMVEFIDFMIDPPGKKLTPPKSDVPQKKCPKCSSTLEDIAKSSRIGCAECYTHFEKELERVIQVNQGSLKHIGKRPKAFGGMSQEETEERAEKLKAQARLAAEAAKRKMPLERRIKGLKADMKRTVDAEKYEECAAIRDELAALQHRFKQIKKLKSQMKRAIKNEQYERADSLKKQIEELEKNE